jgi:hypothetical protein
MDPVGTFPKGISGLVLLPLLLRRKLPREYFLSRLYHTAFVLAVYASRFGHPNVQDSLPVGCQPFPDRTFTCWVTKKSFYVLHFPSLQTYPGAKQFEMYAKRRVFGRHTEVSRVQAANNAGLRTHTDTVLFADCVSYSYGNSGVRY